MEPNNPYLELLSEIDRHGLIEPYNVSPFMSKKFKRPKYVQGSDIWNKEQERKAKGFLDKMRNMGWIEYDPDELVAKIHGVRPDFTTNSDSQSAWFDDVDFHIRFTLAGFEYLGQKRLMDSTTKTNRMSRLYFLATMVFSGVAALMSVLGFLKGCLPKKSNVRLPLQEQRTPAKSTKPL